MNKILVEGYTAGNNILAVKRNSGVVDYIPYVCNDEIPEGTHVAFTGSLNTKNVYDSEGVRHKEMYVWGNITDPTNKYQNEVEFDGFICSKDVLRDTPKGRVIMDFVVAINSGYHRSSYISCICWGGTARHVNNLAIGTKVHVKGRFQSRDYKKNEECKTAYEISINELEEVKDKPIEYKYTMIGTELVLDER